MLNATNAPALVIAATTDAAAPIATVEAPAKPAKAPKPKAAKPAKPAVAHTGPKRTASGGVDLSKPGDKPAPVATVAKPAPVVSDADEAARCQALRDIAARYYDQASLAAHQRKPAKRDEYASRVTKPVQRIGNSGPSTRDESGLALILSGANRTGEFDPCKLNLDLGIASRLASVGFLAFESDTFKLTKPGRERANLVVKRAA